MMGVSITTDAEYQKYNFFRTPDWRWERVLSLVDRPGEPAGRCTRRDDNIVRTAKSFVLRRRNGDEQTINKLLVECPGLFYAYDYYRRVQDDPEAAMYIQARLLARQSYEAIARELHVLPDSVKWYADLFFDVVPYLDNRDWITKQVIIPALRRSAHVQGDANNNNVFKDTIVARPIMDGTLKMFAYFGGPHVADVMIHGLQSDMAMERTDVGSWFNKVLASTLGKRSAQAAQTFQVTKYNVMQLFEAHTRLVELAQNADSKDQSKTSYERHVQSVIDDIPWATGADGDSLYGKTTVGKFDGMASELRDDELLLIASGRTADTVERPNFPSQLPPPRKSKKSMLSANSDDI